MAGITLAQAEGQLAEALEMLSAARRGAYSTPSGVRVEPHRLADYQADVKFWNAQVVRLSRGGIRVRGITPAEVR